VYGSKGDIELYNIYIGRFVSEYGMQGMVPLSSLRQFTKESDWQYNSSIIQIHERKIEGWGILTYYMDKYFKPVKDFKSFVYGTMVL
jgi:beta-mannosidase